MLQVGATRIKIDRGIVSCLVSDATGIKTKQRRCRLMNEFDALAKMSIGRGNQSIRRKCAQMLFGPP
jgi:hypothetical protein